MTITLLHLSDIQFGRHHRFEDDADDPRGDNDAPSLDTLYQRLADDLGELATGDPSLRPQIVVVTGDLAEWGRPKEFDQARVLLQRLQELLKLPRHRIVIIPGNHDVNRSLCESYFNRCEGLDEEPQAPYWPKWEPYERMFKAFYRDVPTVDFDDETPWTFYEMSELRCVVAGLNSTMAETHRDDDHYGQIGERQLRWFQERLRQYREMGWLRLGAVHHNPIRAAVFDDANLRDADDFERVLVPALNLVLHGHRHETRFHQLGQNVPILALGSAGVTTKDRPPEVPNQYQLVQVRPDGFCRYARCYVPGQKRWVGDTSVSEKGDSWKDDRGRRYRPRLVVSRFAFRR